MLKVSIIIPCYNVESVISQCLDSILAQTYQEYKVICVNDGSTDQTLQLIDLYVKKDRRFTVTDQQNTGLSGARNAGIQSAETDFMMFVDADDWLEPNCIEMAMNNMHADMLCFSYNRVFGTFIKPRKLNLEGEYGASIIQRRMVGLYGHELSDPSQADSLVTAWGKLYRREIIMDNYIRFTDTRLIGTEDALFNIEYLNYADTVYIIDRPLYNYRKNEGNSLTQTYKADLFGKWKNLYSKIAQIIESKDQVFKTALQNRICLGLIGLGLNETFADSSFGHKHARLKTILSDELYKEPFRNLNFKYFPLHWKLFFVFAKYRLTLPLLTLLYIIKNRIGDGKN